MATLKIVASLLLLVGLVLADNAEEGELFEGDMELNAEQKLDVDLSSAGIPTFGATKYPNWPREIPYAIHSGLSRYSRATTAIRDAINDYHRYTCLRFRPRKSNENAYIHFVPGSGCSSPVGYWRQVNNIKLASGCWRKGTVIHEIMHSLGFMHEQSRPDRDNYVTIVWNNIPKDKQHNFKKYDAGRINSFGSPYDYSSVMHYGSTAFGGGRTTIQVRRSGATIGQRSGFSREDINQIRKKYGC